MKHPKLRSLVLITALSGRSILSEAQTAYFSIAPKLRINTTTGALSSFSTSGTDIQSCYSGTSSGSGFAPNTIANSLYGYNPPNGTSTGAMYFVFTTCGIYNGAGALVGPAQNFDVNAFTLPGKCNRLYAVQSVLQQGTNPAKLVMHEYDVSNPNSVSETAGSPITISTGYGGDVPIAISPLDANGSRKVYMGQNDGIISWTINSNATIVSSTPVTEYTTSGVSIIDSKCRLEVSPDGQKVFFSDIGNRMNIYTVGNPVVNTIGNTGSQMIAGFEYVPANQTNDGHERIYVSSHNITTGAGGLVYFDMTTNSATPTSVTSITPAAYGYTEIERARNGMLYLAYNPGFGSTAPTGTYQLYATPGLLFSLNPATSTLAQVMNSGTSIPVNCYNTIRYGIQNQIDGENYDFVDFKPGIQQLNINSLNPYYTRYQLQLATDPYHLNAPTIWNCNGTLNVSALVNTQYSSYSVTVEKGTLLLTPDGFGGNFQGFSPTAGGSYTTGTVNSAPVNNTVSLTTGNFAGMASYTGLIRITYTINGTCGSDSYSQVFMLQNVNQLVDFLIVGPTDNNGTPVCSGVTGVPGAQNKWLSPTFSPASLSTSAAAPPCNTGWLGAASAGIRNGVAVGIPAGNTYTVDVDEFTSGNVYIHQVVHKTGLASVPNTPPFTFNNRSTPVGYFVNNYDAIKNNYIYKVTLSTTTTECGFVSAYSYFKIIDGGMSGSTNSPESWRLANSSTNPDELIEPVHIFPNPAIDNVHVSWLSKADNAGKANITVTDVLGKIVLQKELPQLQGTNETTLDISVLAPGIYHYVLHTANGDNNGKLVKQ